MYNVNPFYGYSNVCVRACMLWSIFSWHWQGVTTPVEGYIIPLKNDFFESNRKKRFVFMKWNSNRNSIKIELRQVIKFEPWTTASFHSRIEKKNRTQQIDYYLLIEKSIFFWTKFSIIADDSYDSLSTYMLCCLLPEEKVQRINFFRFKTI